MTDELAQRLRRLEDRFELLELPARYSRSIDDRDIATLVDLFCEDGAFVHADGGRQIVGRQEIEDFYRRVLSGYGMSIHIPHAQVVNRIDGDEASGWVLAHAELAAGTEYVVVALRYEDDYRRVDGRWRFARRALSFWYFANWRDLADVVPDRDRLRAGGRSRLPDLPESLPTYLEFTASMQRDVEA
jgi:uncharacterized protein (TIGR02246 family)